MTDIIADDNQNLVDVASKTDLKSLQVLAKMKEKAYNLCKAFLGGAWKKIPLDDMVFKRISGGITNLLYYCGLPDYCETENEPVDCLYRQYGRIHGKGGDAICTENVIFMLLSERKLGPKLYGVFEEGRLEEYIPASCLRRKQLKDSDLASHIARKLAHVHAIDAPINKEPVWMIKTIERWLKDVNEKVDKAPENEEESIKFPRYRSYKLDEELKWLWLLAIRECILALLANAHFSKAFDIANYFLESSYEYERKTSPYFDYYPQDFPTIQEQLHFIRSYLRSREQIAVGRNVGNDIETSSTTTAEEEIILFEVEVFQLLANFFWVLWSFINAFDSKILFGYWDHGEARLNEYIGHKKKLLSGNTKFQELIKEMESEKN
ncbi:Choline/ethanolamine kinase [Nymphon striatum]|nr:Choline/ethanolamine kinase [Nymphon striatum]